MSRKKEEHEKEPNHERWLVSYADFITLLFAVFVTLYAMSQVDKAKVAKVIASTNEAFGVSKSTSAPAFNVIDTSNLIPLPNLMKKTSNDTRPPGGDRYKSKIKPEPKDLVDEVFTSPDLAPVQEKKELTEVRKKEKLEAETKDLEAEIKKLEAEKKKLEAEVKEPAQVEKTGPAEAENKKQLEAQLQQKIESLQAALQEKTAVEISPAASQMQQPETQTQQKTATTPEEGKEIKVRADVRQFKKIESNISAFLKEKGAEDKVSMTITSRGLVISLKDTAFFDSGKANVRAGSMYLLDNIIKSIKKYSNSIRIEGHTDNVPIKTSQFPSNWELSTARATNIVRYLIDAQDFPPERISAIGYGEYRPIADNSTEEGRQKNRRVDLVVLSSAGEQGEPTAPGKEP